MPAAFPSGFEEHFPLLASRMTDRRGFYEQRAASRATARVGGYSRLLQTCYSFFVPPGLRVLELGCGQGDLLAAVKPERGVGVDFSPATIAQARQRHPQCEFQVAEATELTGEEKFDYVLLP